MMHLEFNRRILFCFNVSYFVAIARVTPGEHNHRMDIAASSSANQPHSQSSSRVAPRPLTVRSALTNDPLLLRGVDGRSVEARRYRDVAIALADDLGGQDKLSEPSKILVRQAAAMTVQVESLQSKIVSGQDVNLEQLTRLSNVLGRTLQRLGLKKPRARPTGPLADHFSRPPGSAA
jgi:hypothetical protein